MIVDNIANAHNSSYLSEKPNRNATNKWLTEDIVKAYQLIIHDLCLNNNSDIGIKRIIRIALQEQYGLTELEAINVLNGRNVSDYIFKYYQKRISMIPKKINNNDLLFNNDSRNNRTNTQLILSNCHQMTYILITQFRTKECGTLDIKFTYTNTTISTMEVIQTKNNISISKIYIYEYPTDVFQKYIRLFLTKHIDCLKNASPFNAEDIVLYFYNDVIQIGDKIEEQITQKTG